MIQRQLTAVGKMFALLAAAVFAAGAETFPLQLGELAPPLQLGTVIQGSAATAGNALVIEFWATWCLPCRNAIPHLNQLAGPFKNRPIEFINITDEKTNIVAAFLNHNHIDGIVATDPERKMGLAFGLTGLPMTVLVDRKGRIVAVTDAPNITAAQLEALLNGRGVGLADIRLDGSGRLPPLTSESRAEPLV